MSADRSAPEHPAEHSGADVEPEEQHAAGILGRLTRRADGLRSWVHRHPGGRRIWRVSIALAGLIVIIIGVVLLVVPGPGWAIIFLGIGIWATEFPWATSLLTSVRRTVQNATAIQAAAALSCLGLKVCWEVPIQILTLGRRRLLSGSLDVPGWERAG